MDGYVGAAATCCLAYMSCQSRRLARPALPGSSSKHSRTRTYSAACTRKCSVVHPIASLLLPPARCRLLAARLQICAGISHMHSRGFAHMDLKPHNVLIKRPAAAQQVQQQQQQRLLTAAANPASIPRPGSRPRIRATALPDSDEEVDLEVGASLVSQLCALEDDCTEQTGSGGFILAF